MFGVAAHVSANGRAPKPRFAQVSTFNSLRPMKSAYELAMERLEKQSPTQKLTAAQKKEIADIETTCRAKIAEREVFLQDQLAKAQAADKFDEITELEQQLARELRRINEDAEAKKDKVRSSV